MTSSSYSFQPRIDSSRSTSVVGLAWSPAPAIRCRSVSSWAMPEPVPPMVKRRPHDDRVAELLDRREAVVHRVADRAAGHLAAEVLDDLLEDLAVLAAVDRLDRGADQLHAVLLQDAGRVERHRGVERGLAAQRREQRVGPLLLDHLLDELRGDRLDVGRVGELRVGHDRGRVGVDQDHADALGHQHPAGLGAGVVELAGLADDDRPRADDQDGLDVVALRHQAWKACLSTVAGLGRSGSRRLLRTSSTTAGLTSAPRTGRTGTPRRAVRRRPRGGTGPRTP